MLLQGECQEDKAVQVINNTCLSIPAPIRQRRRFLQMRCHFLIWGIHADSGPSCLHRSSRGSGTGAPMPLAIFPVIVYSIQVSAAGDKSTDEVTHERQDDAEGLVAAADDHYRVWRGGFAGDQVDPVAGQKISIRRKYPRPRHPGSVPSHGRSGGSHATLIRPVAGSRRRNWNS